MNHYSQTAEHLTLASLGKSSLVSPPSNGEGGDRMRSTFTEDTSLPDLFRARLQDFFKSGYDRGHMYVSVFSGDITFDVIRCV